MPYVNRNEILAYSLDDWLIEKLTEEDFAKWMLLVNLSSTKSMLLQHSGWKQQGLLNLCALKIEPAQQALFLFQSYYS